MEFRRSNTQVSYALSSSLIHFVLTITPIQTQPNDSTSNTRKPKRNFHFQFSQIKNSYFWVFYFLNYNVRFRFIGNSKFPAKMDSTFNLWLKNKIKKTLDFLSLQFLR